MSMFLWQTIDAANGQALRSNLVRITHNRNLEIFLAPAGPNQLCSSRPVAIAKSQLRRFPESDQRNFPGRPASTHWACECGRERSACPRDLRHRLLGLARDRSQCEPRPNHDRAGRLAPRSQATLGNRRSQVPVDALNGLALYLLARNAGERASRGHPGLTSAGHNRHVHDSHRGHACLDVHRGLGWATPFCLYADGLGCSGASQARAASKRVPDHT